MMLIDGHRYTLPDGTIVEAVRLSSWNWLLEANGLLLFYIDDDMLYYFEYYLDDDAFYLAECDLTVEDLTPTE